MSWRSTAKRFTPSWIISARRRWLSSRQRRRDIASVPKESRRLYVDSLKSHSAVMPSHVIATRERVASAAQRIHGGNWNHYSDALRPEIVAGFLRAIAALADRSVRYLEIGSNRGLSMSIICTILQHDARLASATSIDPYFTSGYDEGLTGPYRHLSHVNIDKDVRDRARELYVSLGIGVELLETTSREGLLRLIRDGREFDLIYIDGSHEALNPAIDFSLSATCLAPGGVIVLDDHQWPDVAPIKMLCDQHAEAIWVTWKTAAYRLRQ